MSEYEKLRDEVTRLHSLIGTKDKEIERLKEELGYAIHEFVCSGLWFDHPTIVRLSKAMEAK